MRVLVTGATGFAGLHLLRYITLVTPDAEIFGTTIQHEAEPPENIQLHDLDLRDIQAVTDLIDAVRPDHIYHLAAQASPRQSFANPWGTLETNIRMQLNIFQACQHLKINPRILAVTSGEIYQTGSDPIDENAPFNPTSPYGVSKIAQDMLALQYSQTHGLHIMRARPFNHMGPGQQEGFVAPDFAFQIARIEAGQQQPVMEVGNLAAKRDFTDVRDVVRAYHLIVERGHPGAAYNIATGTAHSAQELLDILLGFSTQHIEVRIDQSRFLPIDVPIKLGNASLLRDTTGWRPEFSFEQTLLDILNDCRQRIAS